MIKTSRLKKRNSLKYLKYSLIEFWAYLTCLLRSICKWILNETLWVDDRDEVYSWVINIKDLKSDEGERIKINGLIFDRKRLIELFEEFEFEILDIRDFIYVFFEYNHPTEYRKLAYYDELFAIIHVNQENNY